MIRDAKKKIKLECAGLALGQTTTIPCIFCGASHEATLRITRTEEGLLYKCHRASCGTAGFVGTLPGADVVRTTTKKREPEPRPDGRPLSADELVTLYDKFLIPPQVLQVEGWYMGDSGRVVMPVFNVSGHEIGWTRRAWPEFYVGRSGKKALYSPGNPDYPVIHFPRTAWEHDDRSTWVVVEDQPSAIRAAQHVPTCALVGTYMGQDKLEELRKTGARRVVVCLDNDAAKQSVAMVRELSLYFEVVEARIPPCDLKDMKDDKWIEENLVCLR